MYNTSLRLVKNTAEAEDIIQESFLSAFRALDSYGDQVPFDAWLRRIVINRSLDHLRSAQQLFTEIKDDEIIRDEALTPASDEDESLRKKRLEMIKKEAMALPDGFRIVFSLYYYEGYDHEEISNILNISASASRSQLSRAKNKVIRALKEKEL